jgi:hypothetical protein
LNLPMASRLTSFPAPLVTPCRGFTILYIKVTTAKRRGGGAMERTG